MSGFTRTLARRNQRTKTKDRKAQRMKINVTEQFTNLHGEGMKDESDNPLTLKTLAVSVLTNYNDTEASLEEKNRRYLLAERIIKEAGDGEGEGGGVVELTTENLALIKKLIGKIYPPLVVGQAVRLIESARTAKPQAPPAAEGAGSTDDQ